LHNHLSINGLCSRKPARNARIFTLTTARGDKLVTNWEPAAKPGAGARRAIFPHGKARRGRKLAPSIDNNFSKPVQDNNLLANLTRRLFDSLIRFPQSGRQAVWESRLPPA
jgi:hypothetical protein